jgi:predicted DNA-binding transcriptional regulator YafY
MSATRRSTSAAKTPAAAQAKSVTVERVTRVCRLLEFLSESPRTRAAILQKLRIDVRTFYRDLELLRECNILVELAKRKYQLCSPHAKEAWALLPLPDPGLTLGEAQALASGRTKVHEKLKVLLKEILGAKPRKGK